VYLSAEFGHKIGEKSRIPRNERKDLLEIKTLFPAASHFTASEC